MRLLRHEEKTNLCGFVIRSETDTFQSGWAWICLWKALLMFCSAFGTILCVLTAFEMQANYVVIAVFLLGASLVMSFLHYHPVMFDLSYILLVVLFITSILQNRTLVNSGYQAMVNIVRADYQEYFGLNYTSESVEAVADRYRAITYALLYLGFFMLVLLNIAISNHMSVFWDMVLTFPFLQLGLYIERRPSLFAISLLLFSYVTVAFLKRTGHYRLVTARKKDTPFSVKKNCVSYKGHGKTMGQVAAWTFIFVLVVSLVSYPLAALAAPEDNGTSSLKSATDQMIQNIAQSGFASLLNRYQASGGISGGMLGGVSRVSADYEPDLEVTFVPTSTDELYLRSFIGAEYTQYQWYAPSGAATDTPSNMAFREAENLKEKGQESGDLLYGKMRIRNLDADENYLYLPYYTSQYSQMYYTVDHGTLLGKSAVGESYTLSYYPYTQSAEGIDDGQVMTEEYLSAYLEIPDYTKEAIDEAAAAIGSCSDIDDTVEKIQNYFAENYPYTVAPGATPYNKDFVSYFLQEQKKGYCAHFASAGTLLCRAYGIPARYVEGYAIDITDLTDADIAEDEDVKDWLTGENTLSDAKVVTVEVTDASAHAWTEVYIEGFGWTPVDFTPPSSDYDTEEEYNSLMSLFAGIFSVAQGSVTDGGSSTGGTGGVTAAFSQNWFFVIPVSVLLLGILLFVPATRLWKRLRRSRRRRVAYRSGNYDAVLPYYYQRMQQALQKKAGADRIPMLPQELFAAVAAWIPELAQETKQAAELFERGVYGRTQVKKEEMDFFAEYTAALLLRLKKQKILV